MNAKTKTAICAALLAAFALISFFPLCSAAVSTEKHADSIAYLDAKKETIMTLTALSTAASTAVTLVPGDIGTPIADKLADLSTYFLLALCAVFLEKYLLVVTGYAAFRLLVPLACATGIAGVLLRRGSLRQLALKLAIFGVAIFLVVPISVRVSGIIEDTFGFTIEDTADYVEDLTDEAVTSEDIQEAEEDAGADGVLGLISQWASGLSQRVSEAVENVSAGVSETVHNLENTLNSILEKLAVILVTSCIIPIAVLLFFVWLIKTVLSVNISLRFPDYDFTRPRPHTGTGD